MEAEPRKMAVREMCADLEKVHVKCSRWPGVQEDRSTRTGPGSAMMKPSSQWAELQVTKPHPAQGTDRGAVPHRDTQERKNGPNLFPGGESASSPGSPATGPQCGGGGTAGRGAAQTQTPVLARLLAPVSA